MSSTICCPFCSEQQAKKVEADGHWAHLICPKCGSHKLSSTAFAVQFNFSSEQRRWLPYNLRRLEERKGNDVLTTSKIESLAKNLVSVTPAEAADNMIIWMGENFDLGQVISVGPLDGLEHKIGVFSFDAIEYLLKELSGLGYIAEVRVYNARVLAKLSLEGWGRYHQLRSVRSDSNFAFMAMAYGHKELDAVVEQLRAATLKEFGIDLRQLNDPHHQRAGLIDDQLRMAIRGCRFLVADLTHNNNGAYWEAGYAEGLGKTVLYTCKKDVFDSRIKSGGGGTHFDTNHHLHILWDQQTIEKTIEQFVSCIAVSLPDLQGQRKAQTS